MEEGKAKIRAEMEASGDLKGLTDAQINAKIEQSAAYKDVDKEYGVGSDFWRNGTALTGLLAGVLGGNVTGGMAAGAAPYVAGLIKDVADGHPAARIALHTLASAVLVKAQRGNSAAGAAGGFIAASSSEALAQAFYGKSADKLSPDEKTVIVNLVAALGAAGGSVAAGSSQGIGSGANAARVEVENNFLGTGSPQRYTERYKGCRGEPECEQRIRKEMAKESAENVQKLKACFDAKDDACAKKIGSTIELSEKAYTEMRLQDQMAGRAYESLAQHYADIVAHCDGNCGRLEAAIAKTVAGGLTEIAYGGLGAGSLLKPGQVVHPENIPVLKEISKDIESIGKRTELEFARRETRKSAGQVVIKNISQAEAIDNLASNGYVKSSSKDGTVTIMTKADKVYRFYPKSTGGGIPGAESGIPSASVTINGKTVTKLRFPGG